MSGISKKYFSVVHDINLSSEDLNHDLSKINDNLFQWKISFDRGPTKQAEEVIFAGKSQNRNYPPMISTVTVLNKLHSRNL